MSLFTLFAFSLVMSYILLQQYRQQLEGFDVSASSEKSFICFKNSSKIDKKLIKNTEDSSQILPVLIPVPLYGPNNQLLGIMNAAMLANLMGRSLYLASIRRHYKDPFSEKSLPFWKYYTLRSASKHHWPTIVTKLPRTSSDTSNITTELHAKMLLASEEVIRHPSNYKSNVYFQKIFPYVKRFFVHRNITLNITGFQNFALNTKNSKRRGIQVESGRILFAEMVLQNVVNVAGEVLTPYDEVPIVMPMANLVHASDMKRKTSLSGIIGSALDFHPEMYAKANYFKQNFMNSTETNQCTVAVHLRPFPDRCISAWGSKSLDKEDIQRVCSYSIDASKEIEATLEATKQCNSERPESVPVFLAHPEGILQDVFDEFLSKDILIYKAKDIVRENRDIDPFEVSIIEQAICVESDHFIRSASSSSWSTVVEIFRNGKVQGKELL